MPSVWDSRFDNHSLWGVLDKIAEALEGIDLPAEVELIDSRNRIYWMVEYLRAHRESDDKRAYTPSMLDAVQRQVEGNVLNHVAQYASDPDSYEPNLRTGADQVDTVLDAMGTWPAATAKGAAISAGQTFSAYDKAAKDALASLNQEAERLSADLKDLADTTSTESAKLATALAEFEENSAKQLEQRMDKLVRDNLDRTKDVLSTLEKAEESAATSLASLDDMEVKGNRILEAVANRAVAKNYQREARNKAAAGWTWDLLGLVVGGVSVALLLVHLFDRDIEVDTGLAITRLAVSIGALGLAALCFRRGTEQHRESRRAKRTDLRLSTVEAFVANQDDEFRNTLIEGMADRIFLQGLLGDEGEDDHNPGMFTKYLEQRRSRLAPDEDEATSG